MFLHFPGSGIYVTVLSSFNTDIPILSGPADMTVNGLLSGSSPLPLSTNGSTATAVLSSVTASAIWFGDLFRSQTTYSEGNY